ncbi:RNA polymerase sigma-70 factor (ECF subfamily) [Natranaerovirga pectinivora]|uniref:RNA polymerase sigma-70 factor (ECF subfamily) n=1 Tax=Natranaerovirga pectinivora TaxID=682400 RepID=A0A4R3MNJ5_9FIRM|nr:RNA polymerase sigma factor [Natranaerovirga pectinivora]TCT14940.1 RNA polymerase sigma-70 factor (ECF subfamily) [Natranaerovirga pectinivora]
MNEAILLDDLMDRVSKGDSDALGALYDMTHKDVFGYAYAIVRDKTIAEDIMHDVYIRVFNKAHLYKTQNKAKAWILRVTRNTAFNILKKQKYDNHLQFKGKEECYSNTFDNALIDKLILLELLNKLSLGERQVIILYLLSGITQKEISRITGVPLPTVKWRYKSALSKLNKLVEGEF